jgi:hypothetical protein
VAGRFVSGSSSSPSTRGSRVCRRRSSRRPGKRSITSQGPRLSLASGRIEPASQAGKEAPDPPTQPSQSERAALQAPGCAELPTRWTPRCSRPNHAEHGATERPSVDPYLEGVLTLVVKARLRDSHDLSRVEW